MGKQLPVGEVIRFVRENLFVDDDGRKLSQASLYRRCQEQQASDKGGVGRRRFGEVSDDGYARKKIRDIEASDNTNITPYELSVIARAMKLPPHFFLTGYVSFEALEESFAAQTAEPLALDGFPRIHKTDFIPRSRRRLAQTIAQKLATTRTKLVVIVVEGPTSVGKSFFLGHLYETVLKTNFENLRYLNCGKLTIDQILPQLRQLSFDFAESRDSVGRLSQVRHDIVVLDGLRYDQFREGPKTPGVAAGRRPSISDLMAIISQIQRRSVPTDVLLVLENNNDSIGDHRFVEPLAPGVLFHRDVIPALNKKEAVEFLRMSGAADLPEQLAEQIVEYFYGMPMALRTVAEEIKQLTSIQIERYVDGLRNGSETGESAVTRSGNFILEYLNRLEEGVSEVADENDPTFVHPHAFLRLLSVMPGPISKAHLGDIVRELSIRRIGRFADLQSTVRGLPFVVETDTTYDLHGLVRGFLVAEIDQRVKGSTFDEFITREELERIHWRCALLNWRMIKNATKADDITIEAIDSLVHHITKLISLLPTERRGTKQRVISEDGIKAFEARHDSLTDYPLWSIAYEKAAKPFLLDSTFQATRLHGQYHAKARILERLIESVENGIRLPDIPFAELYKEASLCWLHTGRLLSAEELLHRGLRVLRRIEPNFTIFVNNIRPNAEGQIGQIWRLICDAISIDAIIKTRLGRQSDDIRSLLEPFAVAAINIADHTGYKSDSGKAYSPALESGAIRIITRVAELELNAGNLDASLELFAKAHRLQLLVRDRGLDGEAARRYSVALLRSKPTDKDFARVTKIVSDNLDMLKKYEDARGRISNDVIPFLVLEVSLHRVMGNLDKAHRLFEQLLDHRYVRNSECTFVAILEVEMERFRLKIASGHIDSSTETHVRKCVAECVRSHHLLLANEFRLIQAEVCEPSAKIGLLRECRLNFQTSGHCLRIEDCDLLEIGESAVKSIGI